MESSHRSADAGARLAACCRYFEEHLGVTAPDGSGALAAADLVSSLADGKLLEEASFAVHRALRAREFVTGGATIGIGESARLARWAK